MALEAIWVIATSSLGAPSGFDIEITNPAGVYRFVDYEAGSFSQRVIERSPRRVVVRTEVPARLPRLDQPYPLGDIPKGVRRYLRATRRIQSDSAAIGAIAAHVEGLHLDQQADVIDAVLRQTQARLTWALPNEVPDAVMCLERQLCNCIGFSHVAAAVLRRLGIPVRTVRAFVAEPQTEKLGRHTVIEAYYPAADRWIVYEPQTLRPPNPRMLYLGSALGWSSDLQRRTRPFSVDPRTRAVSKARR